MELSEATKKLISQYKLARRIETAKPESPTIHVDEVALRVAAFYEQIRTIVDWKEEHLMRRAAIIRKLKRKFFDLELNNFSATQDAAESLVLELIRGGHFANDKIEEPKIKDVQEIIEKYAFILKNSPQKQHLQFYNWLIEVAACEIEEILSPAIREMALIDFMFESMKEKIRISENVFKNGLLQKSDVNTHIYIAVCQALFNLDKPFISYHLIKQKYPEWPGLKPGGSNRIIGSIAEEIFLVWEKIESDFESPIAHKFYAICEKHDTPFLMLGDILLSAPAEDKEKDISNPIVLEGLVKDSYKKRLLTLKSRMARAAIYSTVSIFITKVLSLVLLEVLIEKALGSEPNPAVLAADVLIPTLLMLFIVSTAKRPSKNNINIVAMETIKLAYKKDSGQPEQITLRKKRSLGMTLILSFVYVLSAFITYGAIFSVFKAFGFPVTSIIIDIIFIALILFAGTAIAKRSKELTMEQEKEGFLTFITDVFTLPVQGLGRWISGKWRKYNALAAFFNALVDMPFSAFVEFLEKWRYFVKEKKEEIR